MRKHRYLRIVLSVALALVFFFSAYKVVKGYTDAKKEQDTFEELSALVVQNTPSPVQQTTQEAQPSVSPLVEPEESPEEAPPETETEEIPATSEPVVLPQYEALYELNSESFGWLTIEGLEIDYPVMYSPARPEYYLNRDFYGAYSNSGVPFIDGRCPADGNYYLIYGHLMQNKSIFGRLPQYADEKCWQENPVIRFDTVFEERAYAVMSCFYTRLYRDYEQGFRYYKYYDLTEEAVFNEYVDQVMALALYDTGVTAEYGDELLVLSTCSHHTADGRFVVVAKRIA